jgi:hypothetical protein
MHFLKKLKILLDSKKSIKKVQKFYPGTWGKRPDFQMTGLGPPYPTQ